MKGIGRGLARRALAPIAGALLAGCVGSEIGGRPLIYKNDPAPESIGSQHGIVYKSDAAGTDGVPTPVAGAAPATRYTQVSRYGDLLFLSGQIALDDNDAALVGADSIEVQTARVMDRILAILSGHGLNLANIVNVTVYLSNISMLRDMNRVYASYFKGALPARTVIEAAELPLGALVQVTVVAGR